MKKCKECGTDFTQTNNRGSEQLYCSSSCRNKAALKRHQLKTYKNEKGRKGETQNEVYGQIPLQSINETGNDFGAEIRKGIRDGESGIYQGIDESGRINGRGNSTNDGSFLDCLKETYNARVSETFWKLKCETLEKEVQELRQDILNLELEIAELEEDDENQEQGGGIISGIMQQFKTDPVTTVSFASELIQNLFKPKPKPDEQTKQHKDKRSL